jgi:hypothetical protein
LAEIAHRLGRKALAEVTVAAKPDTILRLFRWWRASLMDRPGGNPLGGRGLRRQSRI